jgi:hypothetical protein
MNDDLLDDIAWEIIFDLINLNSLKDDNYEMLHSFIKKRLKFNLMPLSSE